MKILQRNLNRSTFVVWEVKRNVSVVCFCSAPNFCETEQRSASQPACFLPDAPFCWSLCHLAEGVYTIILFFVSVSVCVSSHKIVGKCIGILWRSECLLFALIGKQDGKGPAFWPCRRNWKPRGLYCTSIQVVVQQCQRKRSKMWKTDYWRLPRSHCADFHRNQCCPEALINVLRKNRSFMRTVSPWSTN
jgi:hypothetical protein